MFSSVPKANGRPLGGLSGYPTPEPLKGEMFLKSMDQASLGCILTADTICPGTCDRAFMVITNLNTNANLQAIDNIQDYFYWL